LRESFKDLHVGSSSLDAKQSKEFKKLIKKKRTYISKQVKCIHKHHKHIFSNFQGRFPKNNQKGLTNMSHQEFSPGMIKSAWKKDESSCKKGGQDSYKKIKDKQLVRNPRYFSHHKQVIRTQTMGRSSH
jgi:hypothetical protein